MRAVGRHLHAVAARCQRNAVVEDAHFACVQYVSWRCDCMQCIGSYTPSFTARISIGIGSGRACRSGCSSRDRSRELGQRSYSKATPTQLTHHALNCAPDCSSGRDHRKVAVADENMGVEAALGVTCAHFSFHGRHSDWRTLSRREQESVSFGACARRRGGRARRRCTTKGANKHFPPRRFAIITTADRRVASRRNPLHFTRKLATGYRMDAF